jgi:hypothetical protein
MTRSDAVNFQEMLFGRAMLTDICMALRSACNGSADPWTDYKKSQTIRLLKARLATWQLPSNEVDEAVKQLVCATLKEVGA